MNTVIISPLVQIILCLLLLLIIIVKSELKRTAIKIYFLFLAGITIEYLLLKIVSKTKYIFKKKEQTLHVSIPKSLSTVRGDIDKLQQVMFNLILNANKLSPEKSNVYLRLYEQGSKIVIEIEDSAPIIEDTEKYLIFIK